MKFKNHVVKSGDTVAQLAVDNSTSVAAIMEASPAVFTPQRLQQQKEYIEAGKLVVGGVLIFPGDVLRIPYDGSLKKRLKKLKMRNRSWDELIVIIADGKKIINPLNFQFSQYYDTCSDNFTCSYPADVESIDFEIDKLKDGLPEIEIYLNSKLVMIGDVEKRGIKINANSTTNVFAGRTSTRLLEKSSLLPGTPRVFKNTSLLDIAKKVCLGFGVEVVHDNDVLDDVNHVFEKVEANDGETPFNLISRLAKDLKLVVSNNDIGDLELKRFKLKKPVATFAVNSDFLKTIGINSIEINYDTANLFGSYVGKLQEAKNDNITTTISSNYLDEISIQNKSYENIKKEQLPDALKWDEQKVVKDFNKTTIPYPSWLVPGSNQLWACGDVIQLQIDNLNIKNLSLMVKNIIFKVNDSGVTVANLNVVPAETYS